MNKTSIAGQAKTASLLPSTQGMLQRKCACGNHSVAGGECAECAKKKSGLQRKLSIGASNDPLELEADRVADQVMAASDYGTVRRAPPRIQRYAGQGSKDTETAPASVDSVLADSGRPLETTLLRNMGQRFGHDFSRVRIHTGNAAEQSAREVNADAYTVGQNIVFGAGRFEPGTDNGRRLLAHELTHVLQQTGGQALHPHSGILMRKIKADSPTTPSPGAQQGSGQQTRAEVVESYLRRLSPSGSPTVNRSNGLVSLAKGFCAKRGLLKRVGRGIESGFMTGARIGSYFLGIGAIPGAILGALIGGFAGIFGSDSESEESPTPTGSTCICDMVESPNTWDIHVHDFPRPLNIEGANVTAPVTSNLDRSAKKGFVVVPAPDSPRIFGSATVGGRLQNNEPYLILGHELCGHAWLQDRSRPGEDEEGHVEGEDLRHNRTVKRENQIRAEQHLEARGFRLKDPYCGESFSRDRSAPNAPPQFGPSQQGISGTRLDDCQRTREIFFPEQARRFRVSERIP